MEKSPGFAEEEGKVMRPARPVKSSCPASDALSLFWKSKASEDDAALVAVYGYRVH